MPPSRIVISSESEKSFSFAVKKGCEERDHGKHRTPNDFIPLREPTSAPSGHLLPKEGGRQEECVDWKLGLRWRLRRMLDDGILVSSAFLAGKAIKLSGRMFLAPHRGSCPKG